MEDLKKLAPTLENVTRITIVNDEGRAYEQKDLYDIQYSLQDDGVTLKIFVKQAKNKH